MISIGQDGKMTSCPKVLDPNDFAKVQAYRLRGEDAWDWTSHQTLALRFLRGRSVC